MAVLLIRRHLLGHYFELVTDFVPGDFEQLHSHCDFQFYYYY